MISRPNNVITPIYTVSHKKKKKLPKYTLLKNFFSFADNKTGVIGIHIKFAQPLSDDYQLVAYATYPKVAVIDNTQNCQLVDA